MKELAPTKPIVTSVDLIPVKEIGVKSYFLKSL